MEDIKNKSEEDELNKGEEELIEDREQSENLPETVAWGTGKFD